MNKFIGVNLINAKPMTRGEHSISKGYAKVLEGSAEDKGYQVIYSDGYESWSPTKAFEESYRPTEGMSFGLAIEALKKGYKVARTGWNGKDMYLTYKPGYPEGVPANVAHAKAHNCKVGDLIKYSPYIEMKTADNMFIPWLASQSDMLAEDWQIIN